MIFFKKLEIMVIYYELYLKFLKFNDNERWIELIEVVFVINVYEKLWFKKYSFIMC